MNENGRGEELNCLKLVNIRGSRMLYVDDIPVLV